MNTVNGRYRPLSSTPPLLRLRFPGYLYLLKVEVNASYDMRRLYLNDNLLKGGQVNGK